MIQVCVRVCGSPILREDLVHFGLMVREQLPRRTREDLDTDRDRSTDPHKAPI